MWIGIDDTDSRSGGCTTYVMYRLIERLIEYGYGICGYPRLVRLNPNVPWKTRGNGAVVVGIGKPEEASFCIGQRKDMDLMAHSNCSGILTEKEREEIEQVTDQNAIKFFNLPI